MGLKGYTPVVFALLALIRAANAKDVQPSESIYNTRSSFVWPKELRTVSENEWRHIGLEDAPPNFNVEGLTDEEAIGRADAIHVDLRGDGKEEIFINNGGGGSGGRGWSIYEKYKGNWKCIGDGTGAPIICSRYNGYAQITFWGRGGGGNFTKCLLRFKGDRYHLVRLEDWKQIDDEGNRRFVSARDPKPFDN